MPYDRAQVVFISISMMTKDFVAVQPYVMLLNL